MTKKKFIKKAGWPVYTRSGRVSKKWQKSHRAANLATLKKFGADKSKRVNKIRLPSDELLGSHTRKGKIIISNRVPKSLRKVVAYHEKVEHRLMTKKGKR